ncbi:MAG: tetratricopeptide repeat protein, partial [Anaerolineales bacterium]
ILLLVGLIGIFLYLNQVVVPATPPLFIPTPTPTRSPDAYLNEAEQFYQEGKLAQAIQAYQEGILADPNNPAIYVTLARLQVFAGDYEAAIENTQNALLKNPNNPLAHAVQGWALSYLDDHLQAEAEVKKALELDANNALAHAYYAEILLNKGDFGDLDKAIEHSQLARQLDPSMLETHRARGLVLLNTQNIEEAVNELKAAIAINDKIADLHLNLGFAYRVQGENDLAVEELLTAFALNPTSPVAPTEISLAYANEGQFGKAVQYAEQAVKVEPDNPRLHGNLGVMYYRNQELDKAIPELAMVVHGGTTEDGTAVEGLPLDYSTVAQYYWFFGFALAKSNRCTEAVPVFQALLNGVPDYELAVENAQAGIQLCQESLGTPSPTPEEGTSEGDDLQGGEEAEATPAP